MSLNDPQSATAVLEGVPEEVSEAATHEAPEELAPEPIEAAATEPTPAKLILRLESIPDFERHARKCQICNHPEIDDIEDEYISWTHVDDIRKAFKLKGESTIFRHARATGLDLRRRENLAVVLEKVLQEIDNAEMPTVSEILRAARTLARLNARGQWLFPPVANHAWSGHGFSRAQQAANSGVLTPEGSRMASDSRRIARERSSPALPASSLQNSNRQSEAPMKN